MKKKIIKALLKKQKEISTLPPPNKVGVFTPLYRQVIIYFKIAPYRWLVPLAFILTFVLYLFFRSKIVILTTLLQRGF